ncbi:leucine-rich repeat neuronal protein 2 [Astyanax mexicanus]|uniref:leucine-rich repeat neuronal protein 2 n=1 Tax=Astyanax mexicanus TaxID=7994 RepID=UPI0020CB0F3B|nr:leucine-rich repeat neuronal protein 2 [Astyanax mexicanus]XP_049327908.1 leucine-rich repeat neuronal protein 2 [Astyanax mexicanus]XP_049327909.1 leucine-rich repeat neuronal protein 2 [Astyanax mexicanus]XP_049327910.1 leucine-rich repeat neuronal protein 2 [Astyanax mexicanus]XP_049327911.1 leucine-rich repeat neuronal protein 2 [Astyanax mexicanus]XP_049327912.1 leucine-rich repeat neuronal protein 2 [Astyanax mexicanus]XP_049327913.1 leucine-rich repeat neuronal protein 2 [Astyanax m
MKMRVITKIFVQIHLLVGVASSLVIHSMPWRVPCPHQCVCQIKPWYSPQSVYREAPTVDCNDLLLTQLPTSLPPETQTLRLQSNLISSVDQGELQGLANLTELDLSHNSFISTRNLRITDLPALLSLHMEENQLRHLPEEAFFGLPSLQELYLNHNRLRSISPAAFKGLDNLLRLHLNSNHLVVIDRRWFHALPQLEVLMIGGNPVDVIQDLNFKPLGSLRSLVLAGMGLREISERALEGLLNLESISFYDNHLTKVPKEALEKLPVLKFLDLNKNPIQLVQRGDFRDMLHLKELGLNNMEELVSIEHSAMENLPELTKLEITNNPRLSYIHPQAFQKLPSMESLMLNSNALSALHRQTVRSLPSLQEISLHTNPIRCDCLIRWVGAEDDKPVRFIEPQSTFCSEPPELKARRVKEVSFREMAESCLPLIAPSTFPSYIQVKHGDNLALHCRALAEPEPNIYWVIPKGLRLTPATRFGRYQVLTEGTLEIFGVTAEEAGFYTCVAQNLVGADTRSLTLKVEGSGRAHLSSAQTSAQSSDDNLEVRDIKEHFALLTWQVSHNVPSARLSWIANGSLEDHHRHSTRILAGTRGFNLTRLQPGTHYKVCLHMGPNDTSCVHLRTKEVIVPVPSPDLTPAVLLAMSALLLLLAARACQGGAMLNWKEQTPEFGKPHTTILTQEAKAFMAPVLPLKEPLQQYRDKLSSEGSERKTSDAQQGHHALGPTKEAC